MLYFKKTFGGTKMNQLTVNDIAKMIDHSLLKPNMTIEEIQAGCNLAKKYNVASVCVKPTEVPIANEILSGSDVLVTTVVGFPHGSNDTRVKLLEASIAIEMGCTELDMVLNIGRLKSGDYDYVLNDISLLVDLAHKKDVVVKVIFENAYLTAEEKIKACELCEKAGADFIKTSSGYAPTGATIDDLILMKEHVSDKIQVKAAGGVRTLDHALSVRAIGATRFGATATEVILNDAAHRFENDCLCNLEDVSSLSTAY